MNTIENLAQQYENSAAIRADRFLEKLKENENF